MASHELVRPSAGGSPRLVTANPGSAAPDLPTVTHGHNQDRAQVTLSLNKYGSGFGLGGRGLSPGRAVLCACCGSGDGLPAALKVLRQPRDYIVMMSSLNSGPSLPGRRPARVWHGQ
jgi:hypothetical protein